MTTSQPYRNDSQLVQACLDGDPTAWSELVHRYQRLVYSIALGYGISSTEADDIFQNVFIKAFRHLKTLRQHSLLAAWLITITHHETRRTLKRLAPTNELDESIEDDEPVPLEKIQRWERQYQVRNAVNELGSPCRELLSALFLEQETPSYVEIAKRLGVPLGNIGPTRARCFKKLEALLLALGFDFNGAG